jgi:monothiol glutaredoxin
MNPELFNKIDAHVKSKPVVIYMKGNPTFPQCGFSAKAVELLRASGVQEKDLGYFDVFEDEQVRDGIKQYSKWPTLPQVFIHGEFVGGCDIVTDLYSSGELKKLIDKN